MNVKKKKKSKRDGKSRFTKTIAFRVTNALHQAVKEKVGKKNIGKHCSALLKNDIENTNPETQTNAL